jgi:hypothetical protein
MSRRDPELEALLERGRTIRPVASSVRARVLDRAREASKQRLPPLEAFSAPPRRRSFRSVALVAALVAGVASASLGLRARWSRPAESPAVKPANLPASRPAAPVTPTEPRAAEITHEGESAPAPASDTGPPAAQPSSSRAVRPAPEAASPSYAAELELMQRAHASYGSRDFGSALRLAAEHARRFPNGVLAEQREALRVRSLVGAGRSAEARRAAEAFAKRFPRSVLLRQVQKLTEP